MATTTRATQDLKNAIKDQLCYIENSCFLYDKGCLAEAIRIAASINILVELRKTSKGLLYHTNQHFDLLSTVPNTEIINLNRLIITKCDTVDSIIDTINPSQNLEIQQMEKILLTYVNSKNKWHIYAYDNQKNKIYCFIEKLPNELGMKNQKILIERWIKLHPTKTHGISDEGKLIVIYQLNALLNHGRSYVSDLYFPMIIDFFSNSHKPTLDDSKREYIDLEKWKNGLIFSIMDNQYKQHNLTRWDLIKSARDQDGGGHYDIKLDSIGYYHSKDSKPIAKYNGTEITTKNFHLIMLRQLGHELLGSQSIFKYINE